MESCPHCGAVQHQPATGPTVPLRPVTLVIRAARWRPLLLVLPILAALYLTFHLWPMTAPSVRPLVIGVLVGVFVVAVAAIRLERRRRLVLTHHDLMDYGAVGRTTITRSEIAGISLRVVPTRYGAYHCLVFWNHTDQTLLVLDMRLYRESDMRDLIVSLCRYNPVIVVERDVRQLLRLTDLGTEKSGVAHQTTT
jgi:hypothetical protein